MNTFKITTAIPSAGGKNTITSNRTNHLLIRISVALIMFIIFLLSIGSAIAQNQSGIRGRMFSADDSTGIPFANVIVYQNNTIINGANTDIDGYFDVKPLNAGTYKVEFKYVGFETKSILGVVVKDSLSTELGDVYLVSGSVTLEAVEIVSYQAPLIQKCAASYTIQSMSGRSSKTAYSADQSYQQMNTESYDFIKENSFQKTRKNPLSTFSIDVDRASYSNVRRFLNQSQMPPKDAVRIEEMINYFDYEYKQPGDEHPFSIYMEYGNCPWNSKHKLVHIGLQGKEMNVDRIPPNNLVFLLDVSGSMGSPNKLPLLKKSFNILIDKMRPQDKVAIVVYAGAAGMVLPSTPGTEKEKIRKALEQLQSGGSTAGGEGIKLAYKIAKENFIKEGNNRIILATDGDFNVGVSDNGSLVRMIEEKRESGVYLSILGYGMGNYKDARMEQISNAGNGNYAYIDNIMEANKVFGKEIWGTLYTIAKDVKIQIEFNPAHVKTYRLIGYENRMLEAKDFNDDKKDAGEIGSGHSVTALYEIIPAESDEEIDNTDELKYQKTDVIGSSDLMAIKFRYKRPDESKSRLIEQSITIEDINRNKPSKDFAWASTVAEAGMLLRDSEFKEDASWAQVLERAKGSKEKDEYGYRAEFIQLVKKATLLDK